MNLFDLVSEGKLDDVIGEDEYVQESVNLSDTENQDDMEVMTEAVFPDKVITGRMTRQKVYLPQGNPMGHNQLVYLYTPNFQSSLELMTETTNMLSRGKYYYYFYMPFYRGVINQQHYVLRKGDDRKKYYDTIETDTNIHPYLPRVIRNTEDRNMFVDLHTYLDIFFTYTKKLTLQRKIAVYWQYMKPVLTQEISSYNRLVLVNLDHYPLKKKFADNIGNPLYTIFYTMQRYPDLLKDINITFLFYSGTKVLKINPSEYPTKEVSKFKIEMMKICGNSIKELVDDKKIQEEEIRSEVLQTTKAKLGLEEIVDATDKSIEDKIVKSTDRVMKKVAKLSATAAAVQDEPTVKASVQIQVDNELDEDQKLLQDAYNKMKQKKVPTSAASSARDEKLREAQKDLKIKGTTIEDLQKMKVKDVKVKPKDVSNAVETPNKNMSTMTFYERNKTYVNEVMPKDLANSIMALNNKSLPIFIRDIKVEDTSNELNYKETYTISLEDSNRQRATIKVDIPKVVDDRFLWLGGGKKTIKNQTYLYPVVKLREDQVVISSNYNKMHITRIDTKSISSVERLKRFMKQDDDAKKLASFGNAHSVNRAGNFVTTVEYDELAKFMKQFKSGKTVIYFNMMEATKAFEKRSIKVKDGYMPIGFVGEKPISIQIDGTQKTEDGKSITDIIVDSLSEDLRTKYYKVRSPKRLMYVNVKIMGQFVAVSALLGFWEGIETMLKKANIEYRLDDHMPRELSPSESVIRFADTFLIYKETVDAELLLNGIRMLNTEKWNLTDFNNKEPYMEYFNKAYGKASIANALLNFYEWFIDPVTYEILEDLDLPTDIVSLIIYAVSLLADSQHTSQTNQRISRVRSFEIIPMILYGILARQYVDYRSSNGRKKFSVQQDSVIAELLKVPTVEETSTLNPTLEIEGTHGVSMSGFHGINLDDSFTHANRSYDKSMTGIIAPSSSPDAGVGRNKCLSMEPQLEGVRGYPKVSETDAEINKLKDVNLFSPGELSMPTAATIDDPTRLGHAIKQSKHVIPVEDSDPVLVSNGFEEVERFELSSDFVVNADEDGEVVEVNEQLKLIVVKYKSGKTRAVNLGNQIVKNGGGGFYLNNQLVTDLKLGDKFKKDDVIAYHKNFFTNSKYNNCRANMGTLTRVAIMSAYNTYEDATFITEELSERCATKLIERKQAVIGKNSNLLYVAKEGDEIRVGDTLVAYDTSYDDSDLNALLDSLGSDEDLKDMVREGSRNTIKSKHSGVIRQITIYSTVDLEELSPSLQKYVKKYYGTIEKKKKLLESYDPDGKNSIMKCGILCTETTKKIEPNKFGTIQGQHVEDSVLINFYIEELEPLEVASKIANFSGLKNTVGEVIPKGYEPYSDYLPDKKFGTIIAENSILKRMTPSILTVGFANKLVIGFKEYLREIYNEKE